ncbi:HEPN domain-containing protein [Vulcanisaeta sp. JCM 14467]|uniref:HEPN domain-containing protein n=1 Tax=Vulcanisaeta sp. JCM 14467 TaxID=1295370 RepID=UPI0006D0745B|nr:HEPN domain-containing protein [Vulcanisaeta sp. JCM 14467]
MSLDAAEDFMRRAEEYLMVARVSFERGFYNATAVNAEMAAQLAVKALLIKLGVEPLRTHNIRALLGLLANQLSGGVGEEVRNFVGSNRRDLIILEDSGSLGQYGAPSVDRDRAEIALKAAKSVIDLVRRLWNL